MKSMIVILVAAAICFAPLALAGETPAAAKPAFSKLDRDANGELTMVEIEESIEVYPELGLMKKAIAELDVDKNGVISVSEYEAWMPMPEKAAAGCGE